jgi:predicted secreted Zn-dependent protease
MGRGLRTLLPVIAVWLATPSVWSQDPPDLPHVEQVPMTISIRHYDVDGRRYSDVVEAMEHAGPVGFEAVTRSSMSFYYETATTPEGCRLTHLELPLDVEILYPRWISYEDARRSERQAWDRHMDVLSVHENVHAVISLLGTVETYNALVRVGLQPTCSDLHDLLETRTDEANDELRQWQRDYDRVTRHGRDQHEFDLQAFMQERL